MKNKIDILGVQIDATNLNLACQTIESWVRDRKKKAYRKEKGGKMRGASAYDRPA